MYNGEVNAEKLEKWVCYLEVYCRIQNLQDDDTKIQLASLRLEGVALVWWEAKTQEEMKNHSEISIYWFDFPYVVRRKFYPLAYIQKAIMDWKIFRQLKGQSVQNYRQEFRRRALVLGVNLSSQDTLLKYIWGFHNYIRHNILMFNLKNLDEVRV